MLSFCSPSAVLQSTSISRRGVLTHIWYPNFVAAAQGIPLDLLALVARGACVPWSHRNITIEETVLGRLPSPGLCTDSRLKHTPGLSMKEAYLLILELWPQGQASDLAHM